MTMLITSTAEFEPDAFFSVPTIGKSWTLSVTFGFSSDEKTDADFKIFLNKVRDFQIFFVYKIEVSVNPTDPKDVTITATLVKDVTADYSTPWAIPVGLPVGILTWLEDRSKGKDKWITPIPNEEIEVDYNNVAATHLLDSAGTWNAPLPQMAGLTRLVRLVSGPSKRFGKKQYILVPWIENKPPTITTVELIAEDEEYIDVDLHINSTDWSKDVVIRTRSLIQPQSNPSSLIDKSTGFLKFSERSDQIADVLKRLRERAPSLLWTFPQILALQWVEKDPTSPDLSELKRAIWLGMSGLVTLFDPLLMALTMCGFDREGPFVSALIAKLKLESSSAKQLTKEICDAVQLHALSSCPDKLENLLKEAFELCPLPKEAEINSQSELLPVLRFLFVNYKSSETIPDAIYDRAKARNRFGVSLDQQVRIELGLLAKKFQDENAMEAAILRVLSHTQPPKASWDSDFAPLLKESFNGLDATRFAQGSLFEDALVSKAKNYNPNGWDDSVLKALLLDSNWFALRLGLTILPPVSDLHELGKIAASLPVIDIGYLGQTQRSELHVKAMDPKDRGTLDKALKTVVDELFPDPLVTRFLPDTSPRDLPVQIAVDTSIDDGDQFDSRFNGIALLVRRNGKSWCYANIATATIEQKYALDKVSIDKHIIHPLRPTAIDGQRQLFTNYTGVPFASRLYKDTFADGAASVEPEKHELFYTVDYPTDLSQDQLLPGLAYGMDYSIAAHVVSKAGVLPKELQTDTKTPWLPIDKLDKFSPPENPKNTKNYVLQWKYLRTTAVGRVILSETTNGARPRIGVVPEGVVPLASDYPRLGLATPDAPVAMLDILRNADGTGAISLPTSGKPPFDLNITDLWWWGAGGTLTIEVLSQPSTLPDDPKPANLDNRSIASFVTTEHFVGGSIALRIEVVDNIRVFSIGIAKTPDAAKQMEKVYQIPIDEDAGSLGGPGSAWLRIRLIGVGAGVGVTFADPTAEVRTNHSTSRRNTDSLLVMAPSDNGAKEWRTEFAGEVNTLLQFPQVGFVDFDRWFSNPECRALAFPKKHNETPEDAERRAIEFHRQVMTAYIGRMQDPGLADLIDRMPDLSVTRLRLDLMVIDGLVEEPFDLVKKKGPDGPLEPKKLEIELDCLGNRPEIDANSGIHAMLKRLVSSWGAHLSITSNGKKLDLKVTTNQNAGLGEISRTIDVKVPRGVVARLKVRAMVPERFFDESATTLYVFDERMRQLAIDHSNGYYYFEGPSLTIEGMLGELSPMPKAKSESWMLEPKKWVDLAQKSVAVAPAGKARSYDLVTRHTDHDENDTWNWRKLGSIDVHTQRWRFMGRPIYSWFDPQDGGVWSSPAGLIDRSAVKLIDFEREAFFDRDAKDATIHSKQIDPMPAVTVLERFPWDSPSATMFRHRLTLRSRYAGALLPDRMSTQKGYSTDVANEKSPEDWIRVAMLADRSRLQLTRPQLRALIPLTVSPMQGDAISTAPPVMAVFEEPPFVHGGLADRISAEIRTGFGFGFDEDPKDKVKIVDTRKEFGPDPRLTYAPTPENDAQALTLECEGPIGLTFDTPSAPAPAFANTAVLVSPRLARAVNAEAGSLEEHFLSVGFRRYLDHKWLFGEGPCDGISTPIAETCWIEFDKSITISAGAREVLRVFQDDHAWKVTVNPSAIDPEGPKNLAMRPLATADTEYAPGIAILHLPLEEGRASMTVFALPGSSLRSNNVEDIVPSVQSNLPLVLSSFEWHVPNGVTTLTFSGPEKVKIIPTSASPVTQMNWTRTNKSFDMLDTITSNAADSTRLNTEEIQCEVSKSKKGLNFIHRGNNEPLHLHSRMEANPLFVHRHLAVISTKRADGIGRPIEVFHEAKRILGMELPIEPKDNLHALRVITFETPARPLGYKTQLEEMGTATFDLFAVKENEDIAALPVKGLSFTYRPLGKVKSNSKLSSMIFKITDCSKSPSIPLIITIDKVHQDRTLSTVHFSIFDKEIRWKCVFQDGSTQTNPDKISVDRDIDLNSETIHVFPEDFKVDSNRNAVDYEYWGDISMLTIPIGGDDSSFSWKWLFTGRNLEASVAVNSASLSTIREAEARIIAISPPIPVV